MSAPSTTRRGFVRCLGLAATGAALGCNRTPEAPARNVPDEEIDVALQQVGSRWIDLDPRHETIRFQKTGIELNLGAIGKGLIAI